MCRPEVAGRELPPGSAPATRSHGQSVISVTNTFSPIQKYSRLPKWPEMPYTSASLSGKAGLANELQKTGENSPNEAANG